METMKLRPPHSFGNPAFDPLIPMMCEEVGGGRERADGRGALPEALDGPTLSEALSEALDGHNRHNRVHRVHRVK